MAIPGKFPAFDHCKEWFLLACIGRDLLPDITVCPVLCVRDAQKFSEALVLECLDFFFLAQL